MMAARQKEVAIDSEPSELSRLAKRWLTLCGSRQLAGRPTQIPGRERLNHWEEFPDSLGTISQIPGKDQVIHWEALNRFLGRFSSSLA
jgi:hypothetical protein